jgi:hypothetical protein
MASDKNIPKALTNSKVLPPCPSRVFNRFYEEILLGMLYLIEFFR